MDSYLVWVGAGKTVVPGGWANPHANGPTAVAALPQETCCVTSAVPELDGIPTQDSPPKVTGSQFQFREETDLNAGSPNLGADEFVLSEGGVCPECQIPLSLIDLAYVCPRCRVEIRAVASLAVITADKNSPSRSKSSMPKGRLTVVGTGGRLLQGILHSLCPIRTTDMQIVNLFRELKAYNIKHESRGKNPFPLNVLHETAKSYNQVQQIEVKRSDEKRSILAAIIYHTCLMMGFFRKRCEATEFMELTRAGISRGENYLSRKISEGKIDFNLDHDPLIPGLVTAFYKLKLDRKKDEDVWAATVELVERAIERDIGFRSELNSKIYGTLVEILVRREPGEWARGKLQKVMGRVCALGNVNANTLGGFLVNLYKFHSRFSDIYENHGFPTGRGLGWAPPSKKKSKKCLS
jgi:hypothetical protein